MFDGPEVLELADLQISEASEPEYIDPFPEGIQQQDEQRIMMEIMISDDDSDAPREEIQVGAANDQHSQIQEDPTLKG
ncbi:hypothetical protein MRB53_001425 [Persea americana]|uniref:Uncharacterized protein n=1 Tax=Persea americana TaxID=3435 RepID=A0ACC2MRK2_PERAE|nr:hypothetical protein MRB53_001425 [Persea americana]